MEYEWNLCLDVKLLMNYNCDCIFYVVFMQSQIGKNWVLSIALVSRVVRYRESISAITRSVPRETYRNSGYIREKECLTTRWWWCSTVYAVRRHCTRDYSRRQTCWRSERGALTDEDWPVEFITEVSLTLLAPTSDKHYSSWVESWERAVCAQVDAEGNDQHPMTTTDNPRLSAGLKVTSNGVWQITLITTEAHRTYPVVWCTCNYYMPLLSTDDYVIACSREEDITTFYTRVRLSVCLSQCRWNQLR